MSKEIKKEKPSGGLQSKLQPLVNDYTKRLMEALEAESLLDTSTDTPPKFRLKSKTQKDVPAEAEPPAATTTTTTTVPEGLPRQKDVIENLTELRNIANNIYHDLFPITANYRPTYSQMIYKLRDNKIIQLDWSREKEFLDIIDKMDTIGNDVIVQNTAQEILEENGINLNLFEHDILERYSEEKVTRFFKDKGYRLEAPPMGQSSEGLDIILSNSDENRPRLFFEIKLRRKNPVPERSTILQSLDVLKRHSTRYPKSYLFIIIFTHDNPGSFDRTRFLYNRMLQEIEGFEGYKNRCRFVPVSLTSLNQLEDSMHEFARAFLHQAFGMRFIQQEAPQGYPDRNDHILEQNFQFKQSDFNIAIRPSDTKFWRLGFIFSKTDSFPRISEDRHGDKSFVMAHLNVGDKRGEEWIDPNILKLNVYPNERILKNEFINWATYDGSEVVFGLHSNADGSEVIFSAATQGEKLGIAVVDLHEFAYCRISAWCDRRSFNLDTTIDIRHK